VRARPVFRVLGRVAAIAGLVGVGLCGLLLMGVPEGVEMAESLSRVMTGAAVLAGFGALAFVSASGPAGGDPDSFDGGSTFDSESGGGDGGDTGGDSRGGDGGGGGGDGGGE
jgi:hypothetical protein